MGDGAGASGVEGEHGPSSPSLQPLHAVHSGSGSVCREVTRPGDADVAVGGRGSGDEGEGSSAPVLAFGELGSSSEVENDDADGEEGEGDSVGTTADGAACEEDAEDGSERGVEAGVSSAGGGAWAELPGGRGPHDVGGPAAADNDVVVADPVTHGGGGGGGGGGADAPAGRPRADPNDAPTLNPSLPSLIGGDEDNSKAAGRHAPSAATSRAATHLPSGSSAPPAPRLGVPVRAEDDTSESWTRHPHHYLILSASGKPIYSYHGDEDQLAGLTALVSALVSVVADQVWTWVWRWLERGAPGVEGWTSRRGWPRWCRHWCRSWRIRCGWTGIGGMAWMC
eukprot:363366-Chlamydomonas_euryale.AAC.13